MIQLIDILITWCLVCVISFNLVNLFIVTLLPTTDPMERIITVTCYYISIHAFHVLITITFFTPINDLNWVTPYSLGYGPLLYFAIKAGKTPIFTWRMIILHMLPFLLFFFIYVAGLWAHEKNRPIYLFLQSHKYPFILSSFIGYGMYALSQSQRPLIPTENIKLLSRATFLILLTGFLFIALILNSNKMVYSYWLPRSFMYILLLTISIMLLHRRIIHLYYFHLSLSPATKEIDVQKSQYHKSLLPKATLVAYRERLEYVIQKEKLFLDATLSIDKLSQQLEIPKHHLSQVFNVHIGKNFSVYINEARIQYACHLLATQPAILIEQLAYQSGFNSKVSFYRHFKQQVGCTPLVYQKRIRKL